MMDHFHIIVMDNFAKFRSKMKIHRLFLILLGISFATAQPRWMVNLGGGYYAPTLTGFETNSELPKTGFMSSDMLFGYGLAREIFYNTRVGYTTWYSLQSGKTASGPDFSRKIVYRAFMLETYFMPRKRLEVNFALAPMLNSASIKLSTSGTISEWDSLHTSFGNNSINVPADNKMTSTWLGFTSMIGVRYYLRSWLALDLRTGFMNNFYNEANWKFQGKKITGPVLKIDKLPLFTFRLIIAW